MFLPRFREQRPIDRVRAKRRGTSLKTRPTWGDDRAICHSICMAPMPRGRPTSTHTGRHIRRTCPNTEREVRFTCHIRDILGLRAEVQRPFEVSRAAPPQWCPIRVRATRRRDTTNTRPRSLPIRRPNKSTCSTSDPSPSLVPRGCSTTRVVFGLLRRRF